jgi:hypothetical protein
MWLVVMGVISTRNSHRDPNVTVKSHQEWACLLMLIEMVTATVGVGTSSGKLRVECIAEEASHQAERCPCYSLYI